MTPTEQAPQETTTAPAAPEQTAPLATAEVPEAPAAASEAGQQLAQAEQDKDIALASVAKAKELLSAVKPGGTTEVDSHGQVVTDFDRKANAQYAEQNGGALPRDETATGV